MDRRTGTLILAFVFALGGCHDGSVTSAPEAPVLTLVKAANPAADEVELVTPALHNDPLPATIGELVCGLVGDLDLLLEAFDDRVGDFDDDRLNRALDKARDAVVETRAAASEAALNRAFRSWKAATRELEKGAVVPVSGSGFADDLASLGSFFAEVFTGKLIELVTQLDAASLGEIEDATLALQEGMAARDVDEWERSLGDFGRAVRIVTRSLEIGSSCPWWAAEYFDQ